MIFGRLSEVTVHEGIEPRTYSRRYPALIACYRPLVGEGIEGIYRESNRVWIGASCKGTTGNRHKRAICGIYGEGRDASGAVIREVGEIPARVDTESTWAGAGRKRTPRDGHERTGGRVDCIR